MSETISVVVPVYNNQLTLDETCREIMEVHESSFKEMEIEVIFVNDGSTDKSWDELLRLKGLYKERISLINLSRNFGQAGALFAGFNNARGDAVICVSADMQDPISLMAKMVAYWKNNTEIVICYRENRNDGFFPRKFSSVAYSIARTSYPELPRGGFDYWLMSSKVCKMLCSFKGRHNFVQGYLLSVGFSRAFIPYTRMKRKIGKSGYSFVVYSLLIAYAWFMHRTPFSGWAPLMVLTMTIGGMIMIMLGVIGEYIWRIYDNLRDFPLYIIETTSASNSEENPK